jgi:hypothetical protein
MIIFKITAIISIGNSSLAYALYYQDPSRFSIFIQTFDDSNRSIDRVFNFALLRIHDTIRGYKN